MEEAIRNFHKQFLWKPQIANEGKLPRARHFVVGGMGGSHLGAGLLACLKPELGIFIHRDYGLPAFSDARERLYIASSYSGNTEETIDFAKVACRRGYAIAAVSVGGKLLDFARKRGIPHVALPDTGIQPRSALGFSLLALLALMREGRLRAEVVSLAQTLKPGALEGAGKRLAKQLRGRVPIVYASARNTAVAYSWKIKFNETGKIPAFYNVFPELNHNEMTGFSAEGGPASGGDVSTEAAALSKPFRFIFLSDSGDPPKIQKRMAVTRELFEDRGLPVTEVPFSGRSALERIFTSLLVADWTALHLSRRYGTEAEKVPMVEELKELITATGP